MKGILWSSWKNILRRKSMSYLTIVAISIGVVSVVIINIIGDTGKCVLNNELDSMGIGGVSISVVDNGKFVAMGEKQLEAVSANANVTAVTPLLAKYYTVSSYDKRTSSVVWGVDECVEDIVSLTIEYGRALNSFDVLTQQRVCIIDKTLAQSLFGSVNVVGRSVGVSFTGYAIDFEVIGVASSGGDMLSGMMGDVVPSFMYIPYSTMLDCTKQDGFNQIIVKVNTDDIESITTELKSQIPITSNLQIDDLNKQKENLNAIMDSATLILTLIGGISLLVSGISIMTIMLVTVTERTREIGVKKSIGAKSSVIMVEFLCEASLLSFIGGIVGTTVAVCTGMIGGIITDIQVVINVNTIVMCVLICVSFGALFGVYPAYKASKLCPVDALRY